MHPQEERLQRIQALTDDQLQGLLEQRKNLGIYPKEYMRMGMLGQKNPSVYGTNSLFKNPASVHKAVMANVPEQYGQKALVRYFLNFPANSGFLDKQHYWIDTKKCMTIVAWSLSDNNEFWVSERIPDTATLDKKVRVGHIATLNGSSEVITPANVNKWMLSVGATFQTKPVKHVFNKGEGFAMSLSLLHEVRIQGDERDWFCLGLVAGVLPKI